jgi:hypothetical protein
MNIFERAARGKLRFPSGVGMLMAEQLWDLPLTSRKSGADLDSTARAIFTELKSLEEGSFVKVTPDPRKTDLELQLEIVKFVIADKIAAAERAQKAAENAERKRKLLAALSAKQEAELIGMSKEEIEAEIAKIAA